MPCDGVPPVVPKVSILLATIITLLDVAVYRIWRSRGAQLPLKPLWNLLTEPGLAQYANTHLKLQVGKTENQQ